MNLLNSRGILLEGSIVSPTLGGANAIVDFRFVEIISYQDELVDLDLEIFSASFTFLGEQIDPP